MKTFTEKYILTRFNNLLSNLPELPLARILELGCGDGAGLYALRWRYPKAWLCGLDYDPQVLQTAARNVPNVVNALIAADVRALPFSALFGAIVIRHAVVERSPDAWRCALQTAPDLLCMGGLLIVTCYSAPEADRLHGWLHEMPLTTIPLPVLAAPDAVGRDRFIFVRSFTDA